LYILYKLYFFIIFLMHTTLYSIFFLLFILFDSFYACVNFYCKLIFINKITRHDHVNDMCCIIKCFYLHCILIFPFMFLFIIDYFFYLFTQWLVIYLIRCVHKFFNFHLQFLYIKNHVENFNMLKFIWSCIDIFNLILIIISFFP
jgi:hypothetical protein